MLHQDCLHAKGQQTNKLVNDERQLLEVIGHTSETVPSALAQFPAITSARSAWVYRPFGL
jgi:hypothetical protein